jgi:hypothetical protein
MTAEVTTGLSGEKINPAGSPRTVMIITAGADISPKIASEIMGIVGSGRTLRKAEVEELLPNDFSWPGYDEWKAEFERIGYNSFPWKKMNKKEMLILTIGSILTSNRDIEQGANIKGLRWQLLIDADSCPHCATFAEKVYSSKNVPIPGEDTHPGCRCCLMPVLPE